MSWPCSACSCQLSLTEIAAAQYVSRSTVKTQSRSLYRKLDVASRAQAVLRVQELRLL
ncbi:MAG: helix-turn-helix transcriptional regulator [Egibacteraceae bacterium]